MHILSPIKKEHGICILLLAVVLVFSFITVKNYRTRLNSAEQNILSLESQNKDLKEQKTALSKEVEDMKSKIAEKEQIIESFPHLNEIMLSQMKQSGFNGDASTIIDDLMKHNELIPYKGVLGGTMGFYFKNKIYVLSDKWVLAYFDDGHIGGYMLLNYKWSNKGFSWRVIDSYLS